MENDQQGAPKQNFWWIWIIVIIVVIAGAAYYFLVVLPASKKTATEENKSTATQTSSTQTEENWVIAVAKQKADTTSTDTHKLSESSYRMYLMDQGGISYADSTDCKTFGASQPTGIKEDVGKMISNPAVLQVSADSWIMIYEMAPMRSADQQNNQPPGPSSQRDLYLATSTDGKSFTKVGVAIDSSKEDNFFASVPDLIKTPDGKIRLYYVSGGESVGSAISTDNGKTFSREAGFRLTNSAVDPDVSLKTESGKTNWVMYYSVLEPSKNGIYKATSTDGLKWKNETKLFTANTGGAVVDPDVVEITPTNYIMFLGQSTSGGSTAGEKINLYRAELNQSIF